jgi:hypothetical protein
MVFDQNTMRNRKRSEQMRKRRSNHESKDFREDESLMKFINTHNSNVVRVNYDEQREDSHDAASAFVPQLYSHEVKESLNGPEEEKGEVIISDIDGSIEEDEQQLSSVSSKSSFVPMKNILTIKNSIKDNNHTASYLLALSHNNEEEEQDDDILHSQDINDENGPFDSLNDRLRSKSNKEFRHVRLPSGKNYLISSVIEEEASELYTDSELSTRKRSYMKSKTKLNSSVRNSSVLSSLDNNKSQSKVNVGVSKNLLSKSEIKPEILIDDNIEIVFNKIKGENKNRREIAKSEVFNLQFDIMKTFDEISKKHLKMGEENKMKLGNKKKLLVENFVKKSNSSNIEKANIENPETKNTGNVVDNFTNALNKIKINEKPSDELEKSNNLQKDNIHQKPVININLVNCSFNNGCAKKSPSSLNREIFYEENNDNLLAVNYEEQEKSIGHLSNRNPIVEDNTNNVNNNTINNNLKSLKSNRELYKLQRKNKSSIFTSEDLKISKLETLNYVNFQVSETKTQDNCSYININNNINICSPISIHSIRNDGFVGGGETNRGDTDRTLYNPMDLLKNTNLEFLTPDKPDDYTLSSNVKKQSLINLNLTISRNDISFHENSSSGIIFKKKLFEGSSSAKQTINGNNGGNKCTGLFDHGNLAVSNVIRIDILQEYVNVLILVRRKLKVLSSMKIWKIFLKHL